MSKQFHPLTLASVRQETDQAVTLTFDIPSDLKETFQFTQGQYLTLRFDIKGKDVRRAYSMCTSPLEGKVSVTVKRIHKGLVSNYINNTLKAGDSVKVMPPQGNFYTSLDPDQAKTYYLFGGGSGITPLMSILKTVLQEEPNSTVHLFYGNLNEDNIIFREELSRIEADYNGRFILDHILQKPKTDKPKGLGGLFKKGTITWTGKVGVPDKKNVNAFLDAHPTGSGSTHYFICGPSAMMDSVESVLKDRNIDPASIHIERFTSSLPGQNGAPSGAQEAKLLVTLDGNKIEVTAGAGKSILDALQDARHDPPYSCAAGVCATCRAKLLKGRVEMEEAMGLEQDDIDNGFILTCQAIPTSEEVEVDFDVVPE